MIKILFVCLGNICRSPTLAAVLQHQVAQKGISEKFLIDSCATTGWHVGESADARMQESAKKKGIKVRHTSRLIKPSDFEKFDLIIAVNREVLGQLKDLAPPEAFSKLKLACDYSALFPGQDMPDPYYGDASSFDEVVIMSLDVCSGILLQFGEL